jgi:hypothetical protein
MSNGLQPARPMVDRSPRMAWRRLLVQAALAAAPSLAVAQVIDNLDELDALALADAPPAAVEAVRAWQAFAEVASGPVTAPDGSVTPNHRLSLDFQVDKAFAPGWRAVLANRLDMKWPAPTGDEHSINTLKEAYLSWQPSDDRLLDLGRVNVRNGVATGYHPTDFFRAGAVRSVVSGDPGSLKKNRLGSVMLRGQTLWSGGSLTALASPKIADLPSDTAFSPDYGATNNQNRWLLALSQKLSESITPQWLLYGEDRQPAQLGLNVTALVGDATVSYLEWAGGNSRSQLSQALQTADDTEFHQRAAVGATYTASNKLSVTLEYAYNDAAPNTAQWEALQSGSPLAYGRYRLWAQWTQELPTQRMATVFAYWPDAVVQHLDLSAMLRTNLADNSRMNWVEARYHWSHTDLALQWQANSGGPVTDYGAARQQRAWQLSLRQYF